jgi:lysophospholipase L1-like esterase
VRLGKELNIPVIDVFALHTKALDEGKAITDLYWDGLHYTPFGYSVS